MIKAVKILPRMAIHSLANDDFYAPAVLAVLPNNVPLRLISINGYDEPLLTDEQVSNLKTKYGFVSVDSYIFDDVGGEIWESIVKRKGVDRSLFKVFDESVAKDIVSLVDGMKNDDKELLIIHCHAGISRSAAIGSTIAFHLRLDSNDFIDMNPNVDPNKHIMSVMLKELGHSDVSFKSWYKRRIINNGG